MTYYWVVDIIFMNLNRQVRCQLLINEQKSKKDGICHDDTRKNGELLV